MIRLNRKPRQIQFTYKNNVFFMLWEILTDEEHPEKVTEYIREKIFKRVPDREELRKTPNGWRYAVYEE